MIRLFLALSIVAAGVPATASAQRVPVTSCGQVVTGDAELVGDLDCSSFNAGRALTIDGTFYLNGHTLVGGEPETVDCVGTGCTIVGPGTISGGFYGVRAETCRLESVTVSASTNTTVRCFDAEIRSSSLESAGNNGWSGNTLRIIDSQITDASGAGIAAGHWVDARRTTITGCGTGILISGGTEPSRIKDCRIEDGSGAGIMVSHSSTEPRPAVRISKTVLRDNVGSGIDVNGLVVARKVEVSGHGYSGISGYPVKVSKSTVMDSCTAPDSGGDTCCADIVSEAEKAAIRQVVCETSSHENWPVCTTFGACSLD